MFKVFQNIRLNKIIQDKSNRNLTALNRSWRRPYTAGPGMAQAKGEKARYTMDIKGGSAPQIKQQIFLKLKRKP